MRIYVDGFLVKTHARQPCRGRVELACRRGLAFELIKVHRVESILLQELDQHPLPLDPGTETPVIPIRLRFQRPAGSFTHSSSQEL